MTAKEILPTVQNPWRRLVRLIQRVSVPKPPARRSGYAPEPHRPRHREKLFPMF
jgi:hypothetical protein